MKSRLIPRVRLGRVLVREIHNQSSLRDKPRGRESRGPPIEQPNGNLMLWNGCRVHLMTFDIPLLHLRQTLARHTPHTDFAVSLSVGTPQLNNFRFNRCWWEGDCYSIDMPSIALWKQKRGPISQPLTLIESLLRDQARSHLITDKLAELAFDTLINEWTISLIIRMMASARP